MRSFPLDSVDSTNCVARRLLDAGVVTPAFVVAREQTAGRGTRGRSWSSPRDAGLYLSVLDRPAIPVAVSTHACTLAAGVACVEALASIGAAVELKPVNDLMAGGRKLGGILTETTVEAGVVSGVIIGVGLNLTREPHRVGPGGPPVVTLEDLMPPERFATIGVTALAAAVVDRIAAWNEVVARGAIEEVRNAWSRHAVGGVAAPVVE